MDVVQEHVDEESPCLPFYFLSQTEQFKITNSNMEPNYNSGSDFMGPEITTFIAIIYVLVVNLPLF